MNEIWVEIDGFPEYMVSNTGSVYTSKRNRLMNPSVLVNGYLQVKLRNAGRVKSKMVHRLVASAFIGKRPNDMEVNHKDGNKRNNHVANLEYVTHLKNMRHARDTLMNPGGKLSPKDAEEIRKEISGGAEYNDLAKRYGVGIGTIRHINHKHIWRNTQHEPVNKREKLDAEKVKKIRRRLASGEKRANLAKEFNVCVQSIDNVANKRTWQHVEV